MGVAERIKNIRETLGKTQKEMASELGLALRTWQNYEEGVHDPSWKVVEGLVKLGFNADWLSTGEGPMRRGVVTITKEVPEGFGRAKEQKFYVDEDFSSRLQNKLGAKTPEWLAEKSGLQLNRLRGFLTDIAIPNPEELTVLAKTFGVSEKWMGCGDSDIKETIKKEPSKPDELLSDEKLIGLIYEAVDAVAEEWGNDENILSSKEKAHIAQELFRIFSKGDSRQWVTKETMAEQTLTLFMFHSNREKVYRLIKKLGLKPSDEEFHMLLKFRAMIEMHDELMENEDGREAQEKKE